MNLETPAELLDAIGEVFPRLRAEFEDDEQPESFHTVVLRLTPVVTHLLETANERERERFGAIVNEMVRLGGDHENAISTCLLEHASQVQCKRLMAPHLSKEALRNLR